MDVTPRELREIDFRTEWKGYHRDDVDDLLERTAATLEALNERVRTLSEQMAAAPAEGTPPTRETEEMLRRTLVLAQRTADEAVAEAQAEARRITAEADTHARRVVNEAEANARRVAEGERQRLEAQVVDLGARREALLADVDQLERFATEYRSRLRSAIERDLDTLATRAPVVDQPRPTVHDVDVPASAPSAPASAPQAQPAQAQPPAPAPPGAAPPRPAAAPMAEPASPMAEPASPMAAPSPPTAVPSPPRAEPAPPGAAPPRPAAAPMAEPAPPMAAPSPPTAVPEPPAPRPTPAAPDPVVALDGTIELDRVPPFSEPAPAAPRRTGFFEQEEPLDAEVLDDDAFFASLREAVRDDAPLGPRPDDPEVMVDDTAEGGRFGNVFKRRR